MLRHNEFGQPIGHAVPEWSGAPSPTASTIIGRYCTLERLDADRHVDDLFAAYAAAPDDRDWTYLGIGAFHTRDSYREWAVLAARSTDPLHYAVIDNATGTAIGTLSLMRQDPDNGVVEVGYVIFSRALQRTPSSTEAHYLLMRYAFDELGYRRYEWKCDSLNQPSRNAAERYGFTYEGTFRHVAVTKGRNRDTAWFSLLECDWPIRRAAFEAWLDPANFDAAGQQLRRLGDMVADSESGSAS